MVHESLRFYASLTDDQLLAEVDVLADRTRDVTTSLIASLAEVDSRRLYLGQGFSSLYSYCTERLRLSEHAAYNRIEAARTARRFPVVLDLLASGDVTMTTVSLLSKYLTDENHLELLQAARRKTKRQVEAQVAAIAPRRDFAPVVIPLGGERHRLEVTISEDTYQSLQRLQNLMRHQIPSGDLSEIVAIAVRRLREDVERRRLADVPSPRRNALRVSDSRYVPAAVKRAVWKRDASQCAFVGSSGRCPERGMLQLHHVVPFSEGGLTSIENLQLRCEAHNKYEEELRSGASG